MFLAAAGFRFDGESTIPPQAGNASCGLEQHPIQAKILEKRQF
jgi:hypothetical protein